MRIAIIEIHHCTECPYYVSGGKESWCSERKKYFTPSKEIPDWCPYLEVRKEKIK